MREAVKERKRMYDSSERLINRGREGEGTRVSIIDIGGTKFNICS